jgi:hypothetical protein
VKVIGVDEHVWRHTRRGDKYVTVIIDLTGIRDGTGPARLLDMVEGRSKQAFKAWLGEREESWRDAVEVVAMDGFTGFKTATTEELPDAVAVMDPFHVVRLAGDALDQCRRRVQLDTCGQACVAVVGDHDGSLGSIGVRGHQVRGEQTEYLAGVGASVAAQGSSRCRGACGHDQFRACRDSQTQARGCRITQGQ